MLFFHVIFSQFLIQLRAFQEFTPLKSVPFCDIIHISPGILFLTPRRFCARRHIWEGISMGSMVMDAENVKAENVKAESAKAESAKAAFMREALREAAAAAEAAEIPVGAVIEKDGEIVGRGRNRTEGLKDPTAHAEIEAIREAAAALGGWRLIGCRMYVTTEPCAMCAGALVLARIDKVFIGTPNAKGGACLGPEGVLLSGRVNHRVETEAGILAGECEKMMKDFFSRLRVMKEKTEKSEDSL
jgi:tRNA(adenine34) deaminase